jgi:hypothetical protein
MEPYKQLLNICESDVNNSLYTIIYPKPAMFSKTQSGKFSDINM